MFSRPWFSLSSLVEVSSIYVPVRKQSHTANLIRWALVWLLMPCGSDTVFAQTLQVLQHHVREEVVAGKAALVGTLPSDPKMSVSIVLPARNEAQLTALLGRLYDPASPDYRKFLTVAQFADEFGASAADYQSVVSFAQANGLTVTGSHANRLVVPVTGTVAQINQAFHVTLSVYQHPTESRTFFSPDREPALALGVPIAHIVGLNNFSKPRPMVVPGQNVAAFGNVTGSGPGSSYLGSDMRAAYYGGTTLTGIGQAVGIVEFDGYNLSDVNLTFTNAGQTNNVPINNVLLDGATGNPVSSDDAEQVLDIVQAIGMAPGLSQVRVYIGNNDTDILSSMASENIAKELSCSWSWRPDDPVSDDVFFKEFAAQGQSFFAASGDEGAFDAAVSPFFYPQEDDYVTAVGGTHLTTNGAAGPWQSESAWNSAQSGSSYLYGSGGGISPDSISIPSWQSGVATVGNGGSSTLRNVPDVAMEADFDNYLCEMGSCFGDGAGTSFAAPRWAGFMALVNQQAVEAGNARMGGLGFLNPAIYAIGAGANYSSDLHDVTSGNNDTDSQPTWFSAGTGYDLVTGWGSANGQALIDALAGPQTPGFWMSASTANVSVNQGTSSTTTITVTDAGGFTGNVTLAVTSALPTGVTASWGTNPTSGSSALTLTATGTAPAGTTTLTITGTSGNLTQTTNLIVAVHSPTFVLAASPSTLSMNQGGSATSTITVTPEYGFAGSANLSVSGLPSGVTASWGTNPTSGSSVLTLNASSSAAVGSATLTITGSSGSLSVTTTLAIAINGPSFTLYGGGAVSVGQGTSASVGIYVYDQFGFTGAVNLSVSGLPAGVTASFSPNPTSGSSTLTLAASSGTSVGNSTLTITGTSGNLTATTTVALGVFTPTFTVSGPGSISIGQGQTGTAYIYVTDEYGFSGNVTFSLSGLPSGVAAVWSPNPTSGSTQLSFSVSKTAKPGNYPLTITGVSGTQTATTAMALGIAGPTFTLTATSTTVGQGTTGSSFVYVNDQYGFTGSVNLAVSGLPSGVTGSFSSNPTSYSSNLNLTVGSNVAPGPYTFTVSGTSGSQTATATGTLIVAVPTFSVSSYGSIALGQGTSSTSYVWVYGQNGFTGNVTFTISGVPTGVTASFSPNPTTNSSALTLTASGTAAVGQYNLTITGTSGTQTATSTLALGIYVPTFTLSNIGTVDLGQGTSTTTYLYVNNLYGFAGGVTLSATGLPAGVTASFSPNPTTGSSTVTLTASGAASLGQSTVTITGTSGSVTTSTTFTLAVFAPTFTLFAGGLALGQGANGTTYVNIYQQYGFTGNVSLSLSGLPSGVTGVFSTNPATSGSQLTLTAASTAPLGQYTVTLTGTSGSQTVSTTFPLTISPQSFSISASPNSLALNQGASGTSALFLYDQYGFSGNVSFAVSGLPSGVTASFSPNPTTTSSTLALTVGPSATPGQATLTITGTAGSLTASTFLYLTVNTPGFTLSDAPNALSLVPGGSARSTVVVTPQNAFGGSVSLSATGLPSGVTATFSSNPITPGSSTVTLTASDGASPATATATITGTSGSLASSVPLVVTVGNSSSSPGSSSTTLVVTSSGSPATSVAAGTPVTLTAAVTAGSTPPTAGQVNFCDMSASSCSGAHLIGSGQLTSGGTASFMFVPGPGVHSYEAIFAGTNRNVTSTSSVAKLIVTSAITTTTTITQSGVAGNYSLIGTVTGKGWPAPSGSVSFLDTTNSGALLRSAALASSKTTLGLQNFQSPAAGSEPMSIATGDFNGDGILDLAVADLNSSSLTILLGNGDGTFTAASSSPQLTNPASFVIAGDFNRDGKLDLAVTNSNTNSVTILLGNGDGTFTAGTNLLTGPGAASLAVGDFNGDGLLDLAVVCSSSGSLTILLGNGDGTFTASPLSPQAGSYPRSIVMADFNSDGVPDLAVTGGQSNNAVTILLGNGDGSFASSESLSLNGAATAIAAADFNGDGVMDLAATTQNNSVAILLGNGDGTFTATTASPQTGNNPEGIAVADLNGDGIPDLAVAIEYNNSVSILLGNGDGTFTSWGSVSTGTYPAFIATGDFNGDGSPDLAVANTYSNNATILTSQITQTATATATGVSPVGQGLHTVDASYAGDSSYMASVSSTIQLTAEPGAPNVAVVPGSSNITPFQSLTVTVTVSDGAGNPIPTGSVILTGGTYTSASTVLATGSATFTIPAASLGGGTDTLKAVYTPDAAGSANYLTATGTTPVTVGAMVPTVTVTPSATGVSIAQGITVAVSVSGGSGNPAPTGSVTLAIGTYSQQQTLVAGATTLTLPAGSLAVGTNTLTVTYAPDASSAALYASATGSATVSGVAPSGTATPSVTVSPGSAAITNLQSDSVAVSVAGGSGTPTGFVVLSSGSYSAHQPLANGSATFTIAAGTLGTGANTLTAAYSGDGTYGAASGTGSITVSQVAMGVPAPSPIAPGASATATATLSAGSNYSGTMNLACALTASPSGAQNVPICSLSPTSVALAAGGSATTKVTVSTTASSTASLVMPMRSNLWGFGSGSALALVAMLGISSRRRRWLSMMGVVLLIFAAGMAGCGGGGGNGGGSKNPPSGGTTAGSYTFTITGTDTADAKTTASAAVTITVQ